jgi:Ca-activated chloride channel family protein
MTFLWPEMLWLLLIVPALVAGYFYILRRKQESAVKYASLTMVKQAIRAGQRFRRHIPPLLFLLALIAMTVAIARPAAIVLLPSQYQTIILAMDVSGSMRATDVQPNRLAAAQAAAKAFVAEQPSNVELAWSRSRQQPRWCKHRRKIARTSSPPSTVSSCSAAPRSGAASSFLWRRSSRTPGIDVSSFIYGRSGARGVPIDQAEQIRSTDL